MTMSRFRAEGVIDSLLLIGDMYCKKRNYDEALSYLIQADKVRQTYIPSDNIRSIICSKQLRRIKIMYFK